MSDEREFGLIKRCLRGDRRALDELLGQYEKPVYNVAFRITGTPDDAADVTQSVFLKAFTKLDSFNPKYRFFSWIYRIAINESINQNRYRELQRPIEDNDLAAPGSPEAECEAGDLSRAVQDCLMGLKEQYRIVVVLRHFADLSYREIGDTLGIQEKTVKSRLYSARQMMKDALADRSVL